MKTKLDVNGNRVELSAEEQAKITVLHTVTKDDIIKGLWEVVEELRDNKILEPLEHSGKNYRMLESSIKSIEESIDELTGTDERVNWRDVDKNIVSLSATQLKNIRTKYRRRKQMLYEASWNVETILYASENPLSLDLKEVYKAEIEKLVAG